MKKILIIAPSWIGDAVISQPLISVLKNRYSKIKIDVLAVSWVTPIYSSICEVDEVIISPFKHGKLDFRKRIALGVAIRKKGYDISYILPNSFKSALVPFFAAIPRRIGYVGEMRYPLLTEHRRLDTEQFPLLVDRYINLAYDKKNQLIKNKLNPTLSISKIQISQIKKKLLPSVRKKFIVLCPEAEFGPAKIWPAKKFGTLAKLLAEKEFAVLILGAGKDKNLTKEIRISSENNVTDLCGATSLQEAISIIAASAMVVTNDSGLMHIASALGRPTIAIFGSSSPKFTPPLSEKAVIARLGLSCSPCFKRLCPFGHTNCLEKLTVESVFRLACKILK